MSDQQTTLEKAQSISTILAALAIPLILASTGYFVQRSIAENSLKKDYLNMAIGVLRDGGESVDPDMKAWAVSVVSKFSPVPFTAGAMNSLGTAFYIKPLIPALPEVARQDDLGALCDPSCLSVLSDKNNQWTAEISMAGEDEVQKAFDIAELSVQYNYELAAALDFARIAGSACEASFDAIRDINNEG